MAFAMSVPSGTPAVKEPYKPPVRQFKFILNEDKFNLLETMKFTSDGLFKENKLTESQEIYQNIYLQLKECQLPNKKDNSDSNNDGNNESNDNNNILIDDSLIELLFKNVLGNLSAVNLKLTDYLAASDCCTEILEYDPRNMKALYRRSLSRQHLGML
jgi:hypothetical protein